MQEIFYPPRVSLLKTFSYGSPPEKIFGKFGSLHNAFSKMLYIFDIPRFFGGFCPSLVGCFIISRFMAFYVVGGYLFGLSSFRRSVGLLVLCLRRWLLSWFRSAVLAPFPAVVPDPLPGSDALPVLASYIARCGRLSGSVCVSSSVTASGVLCGFPCVVLDAVGVWAWFPCLSSGGFWAWLWCRFAALALAPFWV